MSLEIVTPDPFIEVTSPKPYSQGMQATSGPGLSQQDVFRVRTSKKTEIHLANVRFSINGSEFSIDINEWETIRDWIDGQIGEIE